MPFKRVMIRFVSGFLGTFLLASCAGIGAGEPTGNAEPSPIVVNNEAAETQPDVEDKAGAAAEEPGVETTAPARESKRLAGTNVAQASVSLDEVLFDTFNGSYLPLSEASEADILRLRDAIPPIERPQYTDVATADGWLTANDAVLGYVDGDIALAYPTKILNYHEIVNEEVNGIPVLISYCPLCNSGIVYDRRLGDRVLEFGNTSALYNSDMVMYDRQTLSYWFQVGGDAIVGDLTGQRLAVLPTRFMRWSAWREAYPDSRVLSRDTGFQRPYDRDPFANLAGYLNQGNFAFPVGEAARNPALPAGEQVISLVIGDEAKAYPLAALSGRVVNDIVGDTPVAVVVDEAGTGWIFERRVGEQTLTLSWAGDRLTDGETGSSWNLAGVAVEGPLQGEQLPLRAARFSYWFAFVAAFPDATAYQP